MTIRSLVPWRRREAEEGLSPREYADPFTAFQREMNRMFDSFFGDAGLAPFSGREILTEFEPRVNVKEKKDKIEVTAELPGMKEDDVELSLDGNNLVLKGEKKHERESDEEGYHVVERGYGSFYRRIPVPSEIDEDKVEAEFKDGVLNVTLPKTETGKQKSIKVKSSK
ncbi:MAG: Hsp20/alpha crystallin family protein [bacterium]